MDLESESTDSPIHYDIYDMVGKKLKTGVFTSHTTIDMSRFSKGIYLFRFMQGNTPLSTEKIVLPN